MQGSVISEISRSLAVGLVRRNSTLDSFRDHRYGPTKVACKDLRLGLAMVLATNQPRSSNARDESRSRRDPLNGAAPWLRLVIVLLFTASSIAVTEFCAHASSTEEQLNLAQIYNQKPQAQYNERQTGPKGFWGRAKDNLPALGAILGAVITASVAIVSMSFNYHATLRRQQDTQFDEALRHFGDRDNCIVRAGAAALLAGMAQRQPRYFLLRVRAAFFGGDVGKEQFNA